VRGWTEHFFRKSDFEKMVNREISRACLWGEKQRAALSGRSAKLAKVAVITGSPRFDLCAPSYAWLTDEESSRGPAALRPYILVTSRFGVLHAEGLGHPFVASGPGELPSALKIELWREFMHDFAEFVVLIKELAVGFPQYTVVVRPHPSEDMTFFKQVFATFKNVVVRRDGNVLSWIRLAELVVHSNCTTGIEAVLAGRPTVNFLPTGRNRGEIDIAVAREAGVTAGTTRDVLTMADQLLSGSSQPPVWSEDATAVLNNLKADAIPLLTRETMAVLSEREIDASRVTIPQAITLKRTLVSVLGRGSAYIASKRGRLSREHVERVIGGCRSARLGGGLVRQVTASYAVIEPT
jgi:surface carbohydrate biosynthesis protein